MRNIKHIVLLFILIMVITLIVFTNQVPVQQKKEQFKLDIAPIQNEQPLLKKHVKTKDKPQELNKDPNELVYPTVFDDDPVVDREIIEQKYKHCAESSIYLKKESRFNHAYAKLIQNNPKYLEENLKYCVKLYSKHPEYILEKDQDNRIANSYLGRLLSLDDFAEAEFENNPQSIRNALINANPNLMLSFYADISYFKFVPDLKSTIKSQQTIYIESIARYARILFACRLGADCGQNSAIVFNTCLHNQDLCANSIEELIKTKFSQGQQADIELAVQHLYSVYYPDN